MKPRLLSHTERLELSEASGFTMNGPNMTEDLEPLVEKIVLNHMAMAWDRAIATSKLHVSPGNPYRERPRA